MRRWWRVRPYRSRGWHASDSWSESSGGVTLCNKEFAALTALIKGGTDITLVECDRCRVVLENRALRDRAEAAS